MRLTKRKLLPFLILGGAALIFAALVASKPEHEPAVAVEKIWPVDIFTLKSGSHSPMIQLFGHIEAATLTNIRSALNADVIQCHVREGEHVHKGQILVTLDDRDYHLTLAQRNAEVTEIEIQINSENKQYASKLKTLKDEEALLTLTRRDVKREADLLKKKLGTQSRGDDASKLLRRQNISLRNIQLDISEHDTRIARLNAQLAKTTALRDKAALDLERTIIKAPFDGIVTQTHISAGDRIRSSDAILDIYDTDSLEVRSQIPARYVQDIKDSIQKQQTLYATMIASGKEYSLELDRLSGMITSGTGGLDALFSFEKKTSNLSPGQTVKLTLSLPEKENVFSIPVKALYGTNYLYKVVDNKLEHIRISRLGMAKNRDEHILIESPQLHDKDTIMVNQLPNAVAGLKVKPTQSSQ